MGIVEHPYNPNMRQAEEEGQLFKSSWDTWNPVWKKINTTKAQKETKLAEHDGSGLQP